MNARYDSYKEAFYKKCTFEFTTKWIEKIKILQSWIKEKLSEQQDIAIIVNNEVDIIDTQIELMKLRRKIDLRIEPHPFMMVDFNNSNPVVNEILKYGITITNNVA